MCHFQDLCLLVSLPPNVSILSTPHHKVLIVSVCELDQCVQRGDEEEMSPTGFSRPTQHVKPSI